MITGPEGQVYTLSRPHDDVQEIEVGNPLRVS